MSKEKIIGNSVLFFDADEVVGCAAIIPKFTVIKSVDLLTDKFSGNVFALRLPETLRLIPLISSRNRKLDFYLTSTCEVGDEELLLSEKYSFDLKNPTVVDIPLTNATEIDIENLHIKIPEDSICNTFAPIVPLSAATSFIHLNQVNPFVPVSLIQGPRKIKISEQCGTENGKTIESINNVFYEIQLFQRETSLFKVRFYIKISI